MLKREVKVIGIGNCGCKITKGFLEKGYETMFINGSEQDIQYLGKEIPGDKIMKLKGFDGFGGDTKKSMECLTSNLEVVQSIQDVSEEVVFVIASGAGSTGSGLLEPTISILLGELEEELDDKAVTWYANRIIVPIICLPYKDASGGTKYDLPVLLTVFHDPFLLSSNESSKASSTLTTVTYLQL